MLYDFDLRRYVVKAPLQDAGIPEDIVKTDADIAAMEAEGFRLSVSALQNYLACPAKFYYSKVKGLAPADEVSEALDAGMLGTVLHETMEALYSVGGKVGKSVAALCAEQLAAVVEPEKELTLGKLFFLCLG